MDIQVPSADGEARGEIISPSLEPLDKPWGTTGMTVREAQARARAVRELAKERPRLHDGTLVRGLEHALADNNEARAQSIIRALLDEAEAGNIRAIELVFNRIDGLAKQRIDITTRAELLVRKAVTVRVIDARAIPPVPIANSAPLIPNALAIAPNALSDSASDNIHYVSHEERTTQAPPVSPDLGPMHPATGTTTVQHTQTDITGSTDTIDAINAALVPPPVPAHSGGPIQVDSPQLLQAALERAQVEREVDAALGSLGRPAEDRSRRDIVYMVRKAREAKERYEARKLASARAQKAAATRKKNAKKKG